MIMFILVLLFLFCVVATLALRQQRLKLVERAVEVARLKRATQNLESFNSQWASMINTAVTVAKPKVAKPKAAKTKRSKKVVMSDPKGKDRRISFDL